MFTALLKAIRAYFTYRDNLEVLSALSDRELADIGICRGNIDDVSWQAAHG